MDSDSSLVSDLSHERSSKEEPYRRLRLLGQGTYGKAYLVESKATQQNYVEKEINLADMNKADSDRTLREALILSELSHPNIIKFKEVYRMDDSKLKIIMEYADGGDLATRIAHNKEEGRGFEESQILAWFTQICLAVKHVHDRKIIHRDIKGQNVFLMANGMAKLGDFGISIILNKTLERVNTVVGTPFYLSPQIIENRPYSFKSDIWSLGVLLYEMCALKTPFTGNSLQFLALKIVKGSYPSLPSSFSYELRSLVKSMLHTDESRRPSVHEILKTRLISNKIKDFLSESQRHSEFSHTILHNRHIHESKLKKLINDKPQEDLPILSLLKPTTSVIENEEPPLIKVTTPRQKSPTSDTQRDEESFQIVRETLSSKNLLAIESGQPARSPNTNNKQPSGKVHKNPNHGGLRIVPDLKPNLEGLLDIKANPLLIHPAKPLVKVYTPQVLKKTPQEGLDRILTKDKDIRAARKTEDLNFRKKPPQIENPHLNPVMKRNNSVDQIGKLESIEQKQRPQSKQVPNIPNIPNQKPIKTPSIPTKADRDSAKTKKQSITNNKEKKNTVKQPKKENKATNKLEAPKDKPKPKPLKGLEIKSQQVKKQEAVEKEKKKEKIILERRLSRDKRLSREKRQNLSHDKIDKNKPKEEQKKEKKQEEFPPARSQSLFSEFEQQKYDVSDSHNNHSYAFPQDYYDEPFQDFEDTEDVSSNQLTGMSNIPEMMDSNISTPKSEEEKASCTNIYDQHIDSTPISIKEENSQYTQMINEMIDIMNEDSTPSDTSHDTPNDSVVSYKQEEQLTPLSSKIDDRNMPLLDDLTYTSTANLISGLECFSDHSKLEDLKITLENAFGLDNFIGIYRVIEKEMEREGLELDETQLYQEIVQGFPDINIQQLRKYFNVMVSLVVLENPLVSGD